MPVFLYDVTLFILHVGRIFRPAKNCGMEKQQEDVGNIRNKDFFHLALLVMHSPLIANFIERGLLTYYVCSVRINVRNLRNTANVTFTLLGM